MIAYFDKVGEIGDPTEANRLFGAPSTTLEEWCEMQKLGVVQKVKPANPH